MTTEIENDPLFLIHAAGEELLERLQWMTLRPNVIVDWRGDTELLAKRFAEAEIISGKNAESLPLADHSVDLIFANLVLPWTHDYKKLLLEWRRLLRPEGVLLVSSLGPDTLKELHGKVPLVPGLMDMHDLGDALAHMRFADPVLDAELVTVTYREMPKLLHEMRAMNLIANSSAPLSLELENNVYALTFEMVFGHAFGPAVTVDQVANAEGIVKIPLAHLRRKNPG